MNGNPKKKQSMQVDYSQKNSTGLNIQNKKNIINDDNNSDIIQVKCKNIIGNDRKVDNNSNTTNNKCKTGKDKQNTDKQNIEKPEYKLFNKNYSQIRRYKIASVVDKRPEYKLSLL